MKYLQKKSVNSNAVLNSIKKEITFELDASNTIINISPNTINVLGFSNDEMIRRSISEFISTEKSSYRFESKIPNSIEIPFINKQGSIIYMEVQMKSIEDNKGKVLNKYGSMIDISKYKNIEHCEQKLKTLLENTRDIIYHLEIVPEPKFVYISPSYEEVLGHEVQKNYEDYMYVFNTAHPDDVALLTKKLNNELDYSKPIESRWIHKNGSCIWMEDYVTPTYDSNANIIAFDGVCRDISERKALEKKLYYLTFHDSLTDLRNRTFYDKQIEELNIQHNLPVGIIICDLDNLKIINDTMGHDNGDSILVSVSNLLLGIKNKDISIYRIGGDEFVILAKNSSELEIEELYQNINLLIKNYNSNDIKFPIQLSMGYAFEQESIGKMCAIFQKADKIMYTNKMNKHKKLK